MVNQLQFLSLGLSRCSLNCYQKGPIIFKEANMKFFSSSLLEVKSYTSAFPALFLIDKIKYYFLHSGFPFVLYFKSAKLWRCAIIIWYNQRFEMVPVLHAFCNPAEMGD